MNVQQRKQISGYAPGDACQIHGLRNNSRYNEHKGIIGTFFEDSGRYEVKLRPSWKNQSIKVSVSNLRPLYSLVSMRPETNKIVEEIIELEEELDRSIMKKRIGDQEDYLRRICTLVEEHFEEFNELKGDCYWQKKYQLLNLELYSDNDDFDPDEHEQKCFEIMQQTTICPHILINILLHWSRHVVYPCASSMDVCEEAVRMLQEILDAHYGHLFEIIFILARLISTKLHDPKRAYLLYEEYTSVCESLPIIQEQFRSRLLYCDLFLKLLQSWESIHMNLGELEQMFIRGRRLIEELNDVWEQSVDHDQKLHVQKLWMEANMIRMINVVSGCVACSEIEIALRIYERAGKIQLRLYGEDSGRMGNTYFGISHCCLLLGDAKHAKRFLRKASRNKGTSNDSERCALLRQNINNMQHTRDISISLGKAVRCSNPKCDNIGGVKLCKRCKTMKYCSRACQRAHWKRHKKYCKKN